MYDRLTIGIDSFELEKHFGAQADEKFEATFNAAPTQRLPVITNKEANKISLFQWGFISGLSNNKNISPRLFNVSSESVLTKPMYKKILVENRCVVLVDGFYAWKQQGKKQQIPYYVYSDKRNPFAIAGIWEEYEDFDGVTTKSFNLITNPSAPKFAQIQSDSPAILNEESAKKWLSNYTTERDLRQTLENIQQINLNYHPVSPLINDLKIYDQRLIEPTQPSDQHGNYTLF